MRGLIKYFALTALVFAAGCANGDGTGTVEIAAGAAPIRTNAGDVKDAVIATTTRLELTVKEIRIHIAPPEDIYYEDDEVAGEKDERDTRIDLGNPYEVHPNLVETSEEDDGNWVTMPGERTLVLRPGPSEIDLGTADVPVGKVTQIRLVLDGNAILWQGNEPTAIACPSCTTSGLKLLIDDESLIIKDRTTTLKLMFDLSFDDLEKGQNPKLGPIIRVETAMEQ